MECLMIIDVQNGFISPNTEHVLSNVEELMDSFKGRMIIASKFINVPNGPFDLIMHWRRLKESPETDLIEKKKKKATHIIEKEGYTLINDTVKELLIGHNVDLVYIAGIDTDCCVLKTAIDLFENNIRPVVVTDCCASNGGIESHNAAIKVMERTIGKAQMISHI